MRGGQNKDKKESEGGCSRKRKEKGEKGTILAHSQFGGLVKQNQHHFVTPISDRSL